MDDFKDSRDEPKVVPISAAKGKAKPGAKGSCYSVYPPEELRRSDGMFADNVLLVSGSTSQLYALRTGISMGKEPGEYYLNDVHGDFEVVTRTEGGEVVEEKVSASALFFRLRDPRRQVVTKVDMRPLPLGDTPGEARQRAELLIQDREARIANRWPHLVDNLAPASDLADPQDSRSVDFFLPELAHICGFSEATEAMIAHSEDPTGSALADYATDFHEALGDPAKNDPRLQVARLILFCLHRQRFEAWKGHPQFFLVLASAEQGTGKGVLQWTMHGFFGDLACELEASGLGHRFTDPAGIHKLWATYEEMAPSGRFNIEAAKGIITSLKARTTSQTRKFELKGRDKAEQLNTLFECFSTNSESALAVDDYERRMLAVGPQPLPVRYDLEDPITKPNIRNKLKAGFFRDYARHFGMAKKADPAQGPGLHDLVAYVRDLPELLPKVWPTLADMDAPATLKSKAMASATRSRHASELEYLIEEAAGCFALDYCVAGALKDELGIRAASNRDLPTSFNAIATAMEALGAVKVRLPGDGRFVWVWRNHAKWITYNGKYGGATPTDDLVEALGGKK